MKIFLTLILLIPSLSWGQMTSLKEYIQSQPELNNEEMLYISTRCHALYNIIAEVTESRPELKNESDIAKEKTGILTMMIIQELYPDETSDFKTKMPANIVKGMVKTYSEMVNQSYIDTGNYINDFMYDDFQVCGSLLSEL